MNQAIAIIGGGNLGRAIAEGLIASKLYQPKEVTITRRKLSELDDLKEKGHPIIDDNIAAIKSAKIIVIAIKPYQILDELKYLSSHFTSDQILISVVTGISINQMQEATRTNLNIFRAMPNTAIAIRESMTCISTTVKDESMRSQVKTIFDKMGESLYIREDLMDSATILGASGIAFALRFVRAATQGGIEIGFDAESAKLIAAQTVKGAASLILENQSHPEAEIDKVTTPRGTTITGLNEMEHQGFTSSLIQGIIASFNKIKNISKK